MTLEELKDKWKDCTLCSKCQNTIKVFGTGNPAARIALIGEGPGRDEVLQLKPFVGAAGQLLDKIMAAIGLSREELFFTNSVLCRTDDKNRTPTKLEYTNCRTRLFEELSIVNPKFILLVGSTALKTVMGDNLKVMESHGKWFTLLSNPCYYYYSILHPAWILYASSDGETKAKKQIMWIDVKKFKQEMEDIKNSIISDQEGKIEIK